MTSCLLPLLFLLAAAAATREPAGLKIRITDRGLELLKSETLKFVEEELSNISIPDMGGSQGRFTYNITNVKIVDLNLTHTDLQFVPNAGLLLDIQNASITLTFHRQVLYWVFSDTGYINASAEGVNINTVVNLVGDDEGRLRINNITCGANISKMKAQFSGTLGRVYHLLAGFLTSAMRFALNRRICPALEHAALVHINSMLQSFPVRSEVDSYIGIDYSLLRDPVVTSRSLDLSFRGMVFGLQNQNLTLVNGAVEPQFSHLDRMIYLALSEFFFDSGLFSYFQAGIFHTRITSEKMPRNLEMLLRTTYFGSLMMNPALANSPFVLEISASSAPKTTIRTSGATVAVTALVQVMALPRSQPAVQLSSMTMETRFNAKFTMKGKRLAMHADLRRFKIFSNKSALESLALIPLQTPLKTMLQVSVVPLINNFTKRGVRLPLPDHLDFVEDVVEYHNGFIMIGANLQPSGGLLEAQPTTEPAL